MFRGWLYLVAMDWYSHFVFPWELDDTLKMPFVLAWVGRAPEKASMISGTAIREALSPATTLDRLVRVKRTESNPTRKGKGKDGFDVRTLFSP